jgi:hypothetical protein
VQQHQGEQATRLGLGRHQRGQHPGEPDGLDGQCPALVLLAVPLVED